MADYELIAKRRNNIRSVQETRLFLDEKSFKPGLGTFDASKVGKR